MKLPRLVFACLSSLATLTAGAAAIEADELAQFLGVYSWSTQVSLPPDSFSAEILQIENGAVADRLLMPTAESSHGESGGLRIILGPVFNGPMKGNYRVTISVGSRGTLGMPTKVPLFDSARSNPIPNKIGEGDFIFFGVPKEPFAGANDLGSYSRGFMLRVKRLPPPAAAAPTTPPDFPEALLSAARAGDTATIAQLIALSFKHRGSLDETGVSLLLDRLAAAGETPAFTVLLGQMRQTNLGKNWQPDDALLKDTVRAGRRELLDAMLASWLDSARLEVARAAGDPTMQSWITGRVAEVRQKRADIDAFVDAAGQGDLDTMRRLLDAGVDVNGVTSKASRHTALTLAAAKSQLEAVRLLLDRGAAVDQPKHPGWDYTPLCLTKSVAVAELLKAHGANVHARLFRRDVSILTYIARWGGADMVEWMLKQGLDPKMVGDHRQNLLFEAGDARTAEILLQAGVDPNQDDEYGRTPLAGAQKGVAQKLIAAGAKLPAGDTALGAMIGNFASADSIEAVINAQGPLDPVLVQRGLISAAHTDQAEVVAVLLAHGAKANEPGFWGQGTSMPILPLMVCTIHGSPKTARVLLEHGADPNAGAKPGILLQNAIQNGNRDVAKILRDAGAKGVSDLAFALAMKDEPKIDEILSSAPPYAANAGFWHKVLPTAARLGHLRAVQAAIEKGVPLVATDGSDNAFEAAAFEGQHEALTLLLTRLGEADDRAILRPALYSAVYNSHPYDEQRPAAAFEKCVQILLAARAPLTGGGEKRGELVATAIFTRYPGGNPKVVEMLVAAGAEPNPLLEGAPEKPQHLSDAIQDSCNQQGCFTPFARTLQTFENLAKVKIKR
jgi:ankyrin repeat protein